MGTIGGRNPRAGGVFPMEIVTTAALKNPRRARPLAVVAAAACLFAVLVVAAWPGNARSAANVVVILGKTTHTPKPLCPGRYKNEVDQNGNPFVATISPCYVEGRLTAFQAQADGTNQPYKVPFDGKIVAWSVTLGNPSRRNTQTHPNSKGIYFLNELSGLNTKLGEPSKARLSVLRYIRHTHHPKRFKLARQSGLQILNPYFGQHVQFALTHPLRVYEDQEVAITIPTWAPMFTLTANANDTYRGSRNPTRAQIADDPKVCTRSDFIIDGHPQTKRRSKRAYGCFYDHNRLLYTATLIKKP
jgi:hypothetical protein